MGMSDLYVTPLDELGYNANNQQKNISEKGKNSKK